ncbi:amino acid adenylation domain-containing protein [Streptomyces sp. NPDC001348]
MNSYSAPQAPLTLGEAICLNGACQRIKLSCSVPQTTGEASGYLSDSLDRRDVLAHSAFESAAASIPDRTAVLNSGVHTTYRSLNQRANQLARYLRARGVGPDVPVGIRLPRSTDLVTAVLAVLKAGGAFMLADPAQPAVRARGFFDAARPPVILTRGHLAEDFAGSGSKFFLFDSDLPTIADLDTADLPSVIGPQNLAYIVRTSGSTGVPKEVLGTHGGMVGCMSWLQTHYPVGPGEMAAQRTSPDFVDAVWEILSPLNAGATLTVVPEATALDPRLLLRFLRHHRCSRLVLVPSLLRALLKELAAAPTALPVLDHCLSSGEELPADLAGEFRRLLPESRLVNVYGMSEAAADVTWHEVGERDEGRHRVPLGAAIPGAYIRLLSPGGVSPVKDSEVGEICVGGEALARGYLGRPGATAAAFVPDPASTRPGARVYRTGDLARRLPDGSLEYRGRADHQVKIRGSRVELAEVDAVLATHPLVHEAACAAWPAPDGGSPQLAAYVVADEPLSPEDLREFAAERLPGHMVPSTCLTLPALPRTAGGKVDRPALPPPSGRRPRIRTPYTPPRSPDEKLVTTVWSRTLGVSPVGVDDGFVALGGNSLLAMSVAAELRERTGAEVPASDVFACQTVARLAERLAASRYRAAAPAHPGTVRPAVEPSPQPAEADPHSWPLTPGQRGLLFLDRLEPGSPRYVLPYAFRFTGRLDTDALATALRQVTARHPVLRTVVTSASGADGQTVRRDGRTVPAQHDLTSVPEPEREALVDAHLTDLARRPFDLAREHPVRAALLRTADDTWVLGLAVHHIVADGASLRLVLRDLAEEYAAACAGTAADRPYPALGYRDFALQQHRDTARDTAALAHWRQRLHGLRPLDLPTDRPRTIATDSSGSVCRVSVEPGTTAALRELADAGATSLYTVLLTAVKVLLHRWTGQTDIAVGAPVSLRDKDFEDVVGFFTDTVVLRSDLADDPPARELLDRVSATLQQALRHPRLPFQSLVEELAPQRLPGRSLLFDVMVAQDDSPETLHLPGLTASRMPLHTGAAIFDLTFHLTEAGARGLDIALEYRAALFDPGTAERLLQHLRVLIEALVREPGSRISRLPMLGEAERHRLLVEFNDTAQPVPRAAITDLVWAQAARTPHLSACRSAGAELTYAQLTHWAGRVATVLRSRGAGPGKVVAVCAGRGLALPVALLAVLATGAAYLPLDPDHPEQRLRWMFEDSGAVLVVTDRESAGRLPGKPDVLVLEDEPGPSVRQAAATEDPAPAPTARPDDVAYVIYTSGSTGVPKGVQVEHRSVVNRLLWTHRIVECAPGLRVLQKTPVTFDVSVWEIFWPLASGGTLVFAAPGGHGDPAYLAGLIGAESVQVAHFVPSMLRAFAAAEGLAALRGLRLLCLSGEALDPHLAHAAAETLGPDVAVHNLYGPTEASIEVSHWQVRHRPDGRVPIGRPIANTRLYVLGTDLSPVPTGAPGELYIGGTAPARGYLGRPALTAERFVPDPFGPPGSRLYRTGDKVRFLADGEIDFLGRSDGQVKIRGFRVELGEIEAALAAQPEVDRAVVVVRDHGPGDRRLVAYLTVHGPDRDLAVLRAALARILPDHMLPNAFVYLDAFPTGPSGKLDRSALPEPRHTPDDGPRTAPADATEAAMAALFAEVLGTETVGAKDNFFDLGGHSLLAMTLLSAVAERFGTMLPLRAVFDSPTPAALAAELKRT